SRRRHTRFSRDWSSDVCSSDLLEPGGGKHLAGNAGNRAGADFLHVALAQAVEREGAIVSADEARDLKAEVAQNVAHLAVLALARSEERRVGKACRCGRAAGAEN